MKVTAMYVGVIGFALGVAVRSLFGVTLTDTLFILLIAFGVGTIARRSAFKSTSSRYLWCFALLICTFSLGTLRLEIASWQFIDSPLATHVGETVEFSGVITREPDEREANTHLYIKSDGQHLLVIVDRFTEFAYGEEVRVVGVLSEPSSFETDLGRTFNYPGYLKARGVAYLVRYAEVEVVSYDNGNILLQTLLTFKHQFMEQIENLIPEPQVGLAEGLLLGVKRALGSELETAFRSTGIIHIVVLSGYNVMLVVTFVTYILAFLIPSRVRLVFGLAAIIAFALLVGLSATVVRASIMASMILVTRATNRTYLVMRALMIAGLIMIFINPYLLVYDTGFQLSFLATMGLIVVAPHLERRLTLMPKSIGLREFLTATLATQIFVLPILLYQIGEFSVVAVVVNVLVLPMVPVAMLLTFLTGMVGFVSCTVALPLAYLTNISLSYILLIATWFASLPFASYAVPAFPFWIVPVVYCLMGYALWRLQYQPVERSDSDDLVGWTVVDECEEHEDGAGSCNDPPPSSELPVFFR